MLINNIKHIIIVSDYFYPQNIVGSLRMTQFSKFLQSNNIPITIVSSQDPKLVRDINIDSVQIKHRENFIFNALLYFFKIRKLLKVQDKKTLLFYSGNPYFYFPIAPILKKIYKIEYILDFRDPWSISDTDSIPKNIKEKYKCFVIEYIEKIAIKQAKYVINVTDEFNNLYIQKYNKFDSSKFKVILNGYAQNELCKLPLIRLHQSNVLKIGISGKFAYYDKEDSRLLAQCISKFTYDCKVYHLGSFEEELLSSFTMFNCANKFEYVGLVPYIDSMMFLNDMNVLILNHRSRYAHGTKLFDYMYLNIPIIAFVDVNSAIDNILKPYSGYFRVSCIEDIMQALNLIVKEKVTILSENIDISTFSREKQFDKLLSLIKSVIVCNEEI